MGISLSERQLEPKKRKFSRGRKMDCALIVMQMDQIWLFPLKGVLNSRYRVKCRCYKPCENTVDKWEDKKVNGMAEPLWRGTVLLRVTRTFCGLWTAIKFPTAKQTGGTT